MAYSFARIVALGLCVAVGCGEEDDGPDQGLVSGIDSGAPGGNSNLPPSSSDAAVQADGGVPVVPGVVLPGSDAAVATGDASVIIPPGPIGMFNYQNQTVTLTSDLVIPAGMTVRVGPGVTFTVMSQNIKVRVDGTLIVEATAQAPSKFVSAATGARNWTGIVVSAGGSLKLLHAQVSGAVFAIHTLPGSQYTVDYSTLSDSFKAAVVESDGTFDHTHFNAWNSGQAAPVNEVSADDVNGTLTVLASSPKVSNSIFQGATGVVDLVRIGGNSKPTFDHVLVRDAHCAFHVNGAKNNSPVITNSIIENQAYGVMAYSGKPIFENTVFRNNGVDFGFCFDATRDNTPVLKNNFYADGTPKSDPTCSNIGTAEPNPLKAAPAGAGPVGL